MTTFPPRKLTSSVAGLCSGLCLTAALTGSAAAQAPAAAPAPAAPAAAAPAESPDALLQRVDKQNNSFKDAEFEFKMLVKEPGGQPRVVRFKTWQKGQKRLVRFLEPGDIKGMGVLIESADTMYALLPAFGNKIRRLGTSNANTNFMGSDLSNEDMAAIALAPGFSAKAVGTEGADTVLELSAKPNTPKTDFPRLKVWVNAQNATISKIEYMDAGGKKLRTQTRTDYKQDSPEHYSPGRMIFVDHRRNNHETELDLVESKLNSGLSDDLFTQRSLSRGQ